MKLGELYFDIAARTEKFSRGLDEARQRAVQAATGIQAALNEGVDAADLLFIKLNRKIQLTGIDDYTRKLHELKFMAEDLYAANERWKRSVSDVHGIASVEDISKYKRNLAAIHEWQQAKVWDLENKYWSDMAKLHEEATAEYIRREKDKVAAIEKLKHYETEAVRNEILKQNELHEKQVQDELARQERIAAIKRKHSERMIATQRNLEAALAAESAKWTALTTQWSKEDGLKRISQQKVIEQSITKATLDEINSRINTTATLHNALTQKLRKQYIAAQYAQTMTGGGIFTDPRLMTGLQKTQDGLSEAAKRAGFFERAIERAIRTLTAFVAVTSGIAIVSAFEKLTKLGIDYNKTIESSTVSIASIIAAQTDVIDQNERILKGHEQINATMSISSKIIKQLELDNLRTTATFEQLVKAFQSALAPGLSAGLDISQIRQYTVAMVQAASAMNVPLDMMAEELRSILKGTITPRNTLIATYLGITNEQIKQYKGDADGLFNFVMGKLKAFKEFGDVTAMTFAGLASNITDAFAKGFGTLLGPLFNKIKSDMKYTYEYLILVDKKSDSVNINPEFLDRLKIIQHLLMAVYNTFVTLGRILYVTLSGLTFVYNTIEKIANAIKKIPGGTSLLPIIGSAIESYKLAQQVWSGANFGFGEEGRKSEAANKALERTKKFVNLFNKFQDKLVLRPRILLDEFIQDTTKLDKLMDKISEQYANAVQEFESFIPKFDIDTDLTEAVNNFRKKYEDLELEVDNITTDILNKMKRIPKEFTVPKFGPEDFGKEDPLYILYVNLNKQLAEAQQRLQSFQNINVFNILQKATERLVSYQQKYNMELQQFNKLMEERKGSGSPISSEEEKTFKDQLKWKYILQPQINSLESINRQLDAISNKEKVRVKAVGGVNIALSESVSKYAEMARYAEKMTGVPAEILMAIAKVESNFNPDVISGKIKGSSGEVGLMQFMKGTAADWGLEDRTNPFESIMAAARYLTHLYKQAGNDWTKAIAMYNAGEGNVKKALAKANALPNPEYVHKVQKALQELGITMSGMQVGPLGAIDLEQLQRQISMAEKQLDILKQEPGIEEDRVNKIRDAETELMELKTQYADLVLELNAQMLTAQLDALDEIRQSSIMTEAERTASFEQYLNLRLKMIEKEKIANINAGVDIETANKLAAARRAEEEEKEAQRQRKLREDLANVTLEYAELAEGHREVYLAKMKIAEAALKEKESQANLMLPETIELYRKLYQEQIRIAELMANGSFIDGFIEGLNEIRKGLDTVAEMGKEVASDVRDGFKSLFSSAVKGDWDDLQSWWDSFCDKMIDKWSEMLANMLMEAINWKSMMHSIMSALSFLPGIGGLFGGSGGGGYEPNWGNVFAGMFHGGGTVGYSPATLRSVNPMLFAGAPRLHSGLNYDEYPAILKKGESVYPVGASNSKTILNVNITNKAPSTKVQTNTDEQGNLNIIIEQVEQSISARMSRGTGLSSYLDGRYRRRM